MTVVATGDDGYDTLLAKWESEGSPNGTFERLGTHGGELWRVILDDAGTPTFLLRYAAGPTDDGYNKNADTWRWGEQQSGYLVEMLDTGVEFTETLPGKLRIKMERGPLDESVWDPS